MIPIDNRNPFAAWGHEEVKYGVTASADGSIVALEQVGFESSLIDDEMKNEVANNAAFVTKTIMGENMPEAFGTNNEVTVYPNVATNAYGMDKDLQPEREPGETLDYYGIQADDLKKYDEGDDEFEYATEDELDTLSVTPHWFVIRTQESGIKNVIDGDNDVYMSSAINPEITWIITTEEEGYEKYNMAKFTSSNDEIVIGGGNYYELYSKGKKTNYLIQLALE